MGRKIDLYPIPSTCIYCGATVKYTTNAEIYGREFGNGKCYKCTSCDAYVGVHAGTCIPLGLLANSELRELKKQCHSLFDSVWKDNRRLSREKAYGRLAKLLGIPTKECHFGWFDKVALCRAKEIMNDPYWYKSVDD